MIKEVENTLRAKFEKVYLYICLCGNKNKLEHEKVKRAIDDENEILKEEFDERKLSIDYIEYRTQKDLKSVFFRKT